jgi:Insertion element 4 transposase N-terminal
LGELTQIVPFEMVDAALAECGAVQQRLRKLPARVVVYLASPTPNPATTRFGSPMRTV